MRKYLLMIGFMIIFAVKLKIIQAHLIQENSPNQLENQDGYQKELAPEPSEQESIPMFLGEV